MSDRRAAVAGGADVWVCVAGGAYGDPPMAEVLAPEFLLTTAS
jgi:hypothetical protein